jgi:hypothetical protein
MIRGKVMSIRQGRLSGRKGAGGNAPNRPFKYRRRSFRPFKTRACPSTAASVGL